MLDLNSKLQWQNEIKFWNKHIENIDLDNYFFRKRKKKYHRIFQFTMWNVKSSSPDRNAMEDTWQISRIRFKTGECSSLNNDGSCRLISLKRRLRLVPESARVVNVFPTPFFLCRWSRGSSWKFMTLWNRVPELLGWRMERRGRRWTK